MGWVKDRFLKDRKWQLEGGEWEPQISFETFDCCPKIKPQEANTDTMITMTLEKGGCFLRAQRITTKQARQRTGEHRTKNTRKRDTPLL
jgi:hypothetical protein